MLTYKIRATMMNGHVLEFEVSAKDSDQARKFGLSTAMQICKTKGIKSKIQSIDVEEFYEDYD